MKTIQKIALVFGIVFSIFAGLAALITYQIDKIEYTAVVPASFIQLGILMAALPFIAFAVVSFIAGGILWRTTKPTPENVAEKQDETEVKQEADMEEVAENKMESA